MRCSPAWGRRRGGRCPGGDPAPLGHAEESGRRALELCLGREIELMIFAGEEIVVDPFSKESLSRTYPFPIFHSAAVVAEDPAGLSGGEGAAADQGAPGTGTRPATPWRNWARCPGCS